MSSKMCVVAGALVALAGSASAPIRITEWSYQGVNGEFVEITNTGAAPVDMTSYSFDDDSQLPGVFSLAAMGMLAPGESAIITDILAADFRTGWSLAPTVKIIGGNTANLGRNDEMNIFDGTTLVDRLTFGDQNFPGTIRTQNRSGITLPANWGANTVAAWFFSTVGDAYGSRTSAGGDVGSPGFVVVPAPGALALAAAGLLVARRRRA